MGRKLTPERQKLKQEALSLRYDYGWTERRIVDQLGGKKSTIHDWLVGNSHTPLVDNNGNIQLLEGDCLEILPILLDKSVDVLLTDPPYSVMDDYELDKKDNEFYHQWLGELIKQEQEAGRLATKETGRPKKCDTGVALLKDIGLTLKDSERAQKVAEHRDLIPVVVAKAEESKDLPTRKDLAEEEIAREMGISQGRVSQVIMNLLGASIFLKDKCKVREAGKTDAFVIASAG